jgi:hypothetical protein
MVMGGTCYCYMVKAFLFWVVLICQVLKVYSPRVSNTHYPMHCVQSADEQCTNVSQQLSQPMRLLCMCAPRAGTKYTHKTVVVFTDAETAYL